MLILLLSIALKFDYFIPVSTQGLSLAMKEFSDWQNLRIVVTVELPKT